MRTFSAWAVTVVLQHLLRNGHVLLLQILGELHDMEEISGHLLNMRKLLENEPSRKVQVESNPCQPNQGFAGPVCPSVSTAHPHSTG